MTVPNGKRAIGTRLSVKFFDDDTQSTTTWYHGTVIAYAIYINYACMDT